MSEYTYVEKPFLAQLSNLGWHTIDQGPNIPAGPARSRRSSFRQVALKYFFTPLSQAAFI